jgi:DNA invertase Pin-like site-specific DNA recombinase
MSERTKAGLARVRAQGTRLGRPPADVDIQTLHRLRAKGESMRSIALRLRISPALVCKLLNQEQRLPVGRF